MESKRHTHKKFNLPMGQQVFSHVQEIRAPSQIMVTWKINITNSSVPSSSPHFTCWAWCHMVWNIPLIIWGHLSWLRLLPASQIPPVSSLTWQYQNISVIHALFTTNPKHSPMSATEKKLTLPQAKLEQFNKEREGVSLHYKSFMAAKSETIIFQ